MKQTLTVTGTGDSLFTAPFPAEYVGGGMHAVADFIRSCDVRLTNLETNLTDLDCTPCALSGGTWINARPRFFGDLLKYGFNFFGTANNHATDYSTDGLLATLRVLDEHHAAHAGTGRSLEEAAAPAILDIRGEKIAVFAVDTSFREHSRAGRTLPPCPGRPGVNFLRHKEVRKVSAEQLEQLKCIAAKTHLNFTRQMLIDTGFLTPDPPGTFDFGGITFTSEQEGPATRCHEGDKKRLLDAVRDARKTCAAVFLLIHCHDNDGVSHSNPPEYLTEFTHDAADAGVSAVFGGGCHSLRGLDIHHGTPIFYSLGDFIYQGMQVEYLPADFKEKYGIPLDASAKEALDIRSRGGKVGLHLQKENFQTVLPKLVFENGRLSTFSLLPVSLNFEDGGKCKGLPVRAEGTEAQEIFGIVRDLSAPFGTSLKMENGLIVPSL